ncbi:MAG: hypothetical protein Q9164_002372 [Protoblastenia rupestris]
MQFSLPIFATLFASTYATPLTSRPRPNDLLLRRAENPAGGLICDENYGDPIKYDEATFATVVRTWRTAFGGGGGELNKGDGFLPTQQAVCCSDWCLVIKNDAGSTKEWDDEQFQQAVEALQEKMPGQTLCSVPIVKKEGGNDGFLAMSYYRGSYWSIGNEDAGKVFGDTCGGAPPYNGPN